MKVILTQANLTLKGGAERVVLKIAQHYDAPIYVAEYDKNATFEEFEELDINVITDNKKTTSRAMQGLKYSKFLNYKIEEDYDVINAHIAPSHWIRRLNERVLWYCHTPLREIYDLYKYRQSLRSFYKRPIYAIGAYFMRNIDKKIVNNIEYIFANSENTKSRIIKYYGREDAKVLNGCIEIERFRNESNDKYFFYPSRFSPNKRQLYAIEAFNLFKKKYKKGNYKLVIAGAVSKDPLYYNYYLKVKERAEKVGDVEILADIDDERLVDLYSRCTAVLYTPINEDYGLVPLEGMASSKPVIAINEGGPRETIEDKKTGYLINSENEMAEKMQMLAENPDLVDELGKKGLKHVKAHYSWEHFFEVFDKALYKVANAEEDKP
ncbi:MAG: glycosyltransferase [Candidatus Micrarchaeia archaeon]